MAPRMIQIWRKALFACALIPFPAQDEPTNLVPNSNEENTILKEFGPTKPSDGVAEEVSKDIPSKDDEEPPVEKVFYDE